MPHLWQHYPDAWVVMAGGSTPYGAQIQQMVAALPSQQQAHVVIRTDIDETAKVGLLAACDLLVLPSSEDSFGIVLVEAWACDKPVVAARTPVMASLVDEGRDGLLFTPGDALALAQSIRTLLTTATGRQQMGNAGRVKVAENFTWDVVTKQVRGVYQRSISV